MSLSGRHGLAEGSLDTRGLASPPAFEPGRHRRLSRVHSENPQPDLRPREDSEARHLPVADRVSRAGLRGSAGSGAAGGAQRLTGGAWARGSGAPPGLRVGSGPFSL